MGNAKALLAVFALVVFACQISAYNVTVVAYGSGQGSPNTPLVGTRIEVLKGSTLVADAIADAKGKVSFELDAGTYFLKLIRPSYPDNVLMYTVKGDMGLEAQLYIKRESAIVYGQISDSKASHGGEKAYVMSGQLVAGSPAAISPEGYFIVPYVQAGSYSLRLGNGSLAITPSEFSVEVGEAKYVQAAVQRASDAPSLLAPATALRFGTIVATLQVGDSPAAGEDVKISTPAGQIDATSDAEGQVAVSAASPGVYTFSWKGLSAKTSVAGFIAPPKEEAPAAPPPAEAPAPAPTIPAPAPTQDSSTANAALIGGGLLAVIAVAAVLAIIAAVAYFAMHKKSAPPAAPPHEDMHKKLSRKKARHKK